MPCAPSNHPRKRPHDQPHDTTEKERGNQRPWRHRPPAALPTGVGHESSGPAAAALRAAVAVRPPSARRGAAIVAHRAERRHGQRRRARRVRAWKCRTPARADHGELDDDDDVLQGGHRGGERPHRGDCVTVNGVGVEEVQDHHRGAHHHVVHADQQRDVRWHSAVARRPPHRFGLWWPAGGGGFHRFGGGGLRWCRGGTRPSFRGRQARPTSAKALANLDIASGKVTAVNGSTHHRVRHAVSPGQFTPTAKQDQEVHDAGEAQDRDAQDHDLEHHPGQHDPDRVLDRPRRRRLRQRLWPGGHQRLRHGEHRSHHLDRRQQLHRRLRRSGRRWRLASAAGAPGGTVPSSARVRAGAVPATGGPS